VAEGLPGAVLADAAPGNPDPSGWSAKSIAPGDPPGPATGVGSPETTAAITTITTGMSPSTMAAAAVCLVKVAPECAGRANQRSAGRTRFRFARPDDPRQSPAFPRG